MKTLIFSFLSAVALNLSAAPATVATTKPCLVCDKVAVMLKVHDEDEAKAYDDFNKLLSILKISSDKKIAAEELKSILGATPTFLKSDERREVPSYLLSFESSHPKEFAEALKVLSTEDREDLQRKMQAARKNMAEGEDP